MTLVDYISSSGLRAVVGANHLLGWGNLTLRGLSPFVKEIFWATGLDEFLNIE